ncbi:uncharacterized protein LOC142023748 [Carettochelys insculpta]|uniref:uncharacterized protein LOC142023748 n=1 Tax=Carettochelys insculpta TaxID=44489 RepID=UPI003EB9C3CA
MVKNNTENIWEEFLIAAPLEGPESTGEVSVVPESPPGPSQQASPLAEHRPAPGRGRRRSHPRMAMDPQLLANLQHELEVSERRLRVEEQRLELQERALAWRQEAWGAFMCTFERIVQHLTPLPHRPPLCPPRHPPSLHHQPAWGLPPRGTMGLGTPPGRICRFSWPPPSIAQGSGRGEGRALQHRALDIRVRGQGRGPPSFVHIPHLYIVFVGPLFSTCPPHVIQAINQVLLQQLVHTGDLDDTIWRFNELDFLNCFGALDVHIWPSGSGNTAVGPM